MTLLSVHKRQTRPVEMVVMNPQRGGDKDGEEEHRYYLLPGMGRSNRRFRSKLQLGSSIAGISGSALIGTAIWLLNR